MSCKGYWDRLVSALASGGGSLDGDVAAHLGTCAECEKFFEAHVNLFGAIDSGVRAMVNESVPASLLPGVRTRMEEERMGSSWFLTLMPVAGILLVALLIAVPVVRYGLRSGAVRVAGIPERKEIGPEPRSAVANVPEEFEASAVKKVRSARHVAGSTAAQPGAQAVGVEVLVDPEESRGLRRLAEVVRESPRWAMAMLHPAEVPSSHVDVIRPVQFSDLEIKPLSEEER